MPCNPSTCSYPLSDVRGLSQPFACVCQNNLPEARRLFNLALRDAPRNRFVFLAWGEMEAREGNSGKARYLLRRGHKWNPSDPALLQAWGRLEAAAGKWDKARYLFSKGVQVRVRNSPRPPLSLPTLRVQLSAAPC